MTVPLNGVCHLGEKRLIDERFRDRCGIGNFRLHFLLGTAGMKGIIRLSGGQRLPVLSILLQYRHRLCPLDWYRAGGRMNFFAFRATCGSHQTNSQRKD